MAAAGGVEPLARHLAAAAETKRNLKTNSTAIFIGMDEIALIL